jgi:hypothetical protein
VRQSTKKAVSIRRFGARVIGIVTGANSEEAAAWDALAQCDLAEFRADLFDPSRIPQAFRAFRAERDRRGLLRNHPDHPLMPRWRSLAGRASRKARGNLAGAGRRRPGSRLRMVRSGDRGNSPPVPGAPERVRQGRV